MTGLTAEAKGPVSGFAARFKELRNWITTAQPQARLKFESTWSAERSLAGRDKLCEKAQYNCVQSRAFELSIKHRTKLERLTQTAQLCLVTATVHMKCIRSSIQSVLQE